jgi:hypothetical protein
MLGPRTCKARNDKGEACRAAPLRDGGAGGQRRRKEAAVATEYDFEGLTSIEDIRRLVEVAAVDALGLDNNLGRVRALGYLAQVATTLLEKGEMEERLAAVEATLGPRVVAGRRR